MIGRSRCSWLIVRTGGFVSTAPVLGISTRTVSDSAVSREMCEGAASVSLRTGCLRQGVGPRRGGSSQEQATDRVDCHPCDCRETTGARRVIWSLRSRHTRQRFATRSPKYLGAVNSGENRRLNPRNQRPRWMTMGVTSSTFLSCGSSNSTSLASHEIGNFASDFVVSIFMTILLILTVSPPRPSR